MKLQAAGTIYQQQLFLILVYDRRRTMAFGRGEAAVMRSLFSRMTKARPLSPPTTTAVYKALNQSLLDRIGALNGAHPLDQGERDQARTAKIVEGRSVRSVRLLLDRAEQELNRELTFASEP